MFRLQMYKERMEYTTIGGGKKHARVTFFCGDRAVIWIFLHKFATDWDDVTFIYLVSHSM